MIIRFTTKNIDGEEKEWCFYSVEAILKDWWSNNAEKLPSGDDPVLEVYIDNEMVSGIEDAEHLIRHLNILYWTRQELPESDIVNRLNTLTEAFVEVDATIYRFYFKDSIQKNIRYIQIQKSSEGSYDYTLFDPDGKKLDSGIRETNETALLGNILIGLLDYESEEYTIKRIMSEEEGKAILNKVVSDLKEFNGRENELISAIFAAKSYIEDDKKELEMHYYNGDWYALEFNGDESRLLYDYSPDPLITEEEIKKENVDVYAVFEFCQVVAYF